MDRRQFLASLAAGAASFGRPGRGRSEPLALPVEVDALANGLRVVLSPSRRVPSVSVVVSYDAGSRRDPTGRAGLASLAARWMLQGGAAVGRGEHLRRVSALGGRAEAVVTRDALELYEALPSHALELALWLESERMRAPVAPSEGLQAARAEALEDRLSAERRPYGASLFRRDALAFQGHPPYAHPTRGEPSALAAVTEAEAQDFHARHLGPDRAVLSLVGDFDPSEAMTLVRRYFEPIPARGGEPWSDPGLPPQDAERVESLTDPLAPLPAFHLAWPIPPRRTPDHYALELLAAVLGLGASARLHQDLVARRDLARVVHVETELLRGPDLFTVWCVLAAGRSVERARNAVLSELTRVTREGVSARELERARALRRAQRLESLQGGVALARALADHERADGNALLLRTELERDLAVDLSDLQRVAVTYLVPARRSVVEVLPEPPPGTSPPSQGPSGS